MEHEAFSVLIWKPKSVRPREGSYVLLKCREDGELFSCGGSYEQGKFWYIYDSQSYGEINEKAILGWSYYPYNE